MDRLTVYIDGEAREDHSRDTGKWKNGSRECMARLAAYEDTGLTPEETAALRAEVERLRAESAAYKADIEAGNLMRLESCDECRYKLESQAWEYYTYPCRECRLRAKVKYVLTDTYIRAIMEVRKEVR
jgi:uncharacterized small protein (DUF1192 family)